MARGRKTGSNYSNASASIILAFSLQISPIRGHATTRIWRRCLWGAKNVAGVSQQGPAAALPIQYLIQPINGPGLKSDKGAECHIKALHKINAITTVKKVVRVKGLEPDRA